MIITADSNNAMKRLPLLILPLWLLCWACTSAASADVATAMDDAERTYADGDFASCQKICTEIVSRDSASLSEEQLGHLAILFMKLSENVNPDENIAEATQCFRRAWRLSADSLHTFVATISPEDIPRYVMLTRIGGSLDFPPDLSEEHYIEDSLQLSADHQPH